MNNNHQTRKLHLLYFNIYIKVQKYIIFPLKDGNTCRNCKKSKLDDKTGTKYINKGLSFVEEPIYKIH